MTVEGMDEDSWLDDREAFWSRHFLLAGAEGAWLPNLCLLREDDEVALTWREPSFRSDPRMTFLHAEGSTRVAWADVQAVLGRFVDEVAKAFEQRKLAPYPWIAASKPRLESAAKSTEAIALYCARPLQQVAELLEVQPEDVTSAPSLPIFGHRSGGARRARCFDGDHELVCARVMGRGASACPRRCAGCGERGAGGAARSAGRAPGARARWSADRQHTRGTR